MRTASVERFDGAAWTTLATYGNLNDAHVALDELIAGGADPNTVRLGEGSSLRQTILMVVAAVAIVLAGAIILYVVLG